MILVTTFWLNPQSKQGKQRSSGSETRGRDQEEKQAIKLETQRQRGLSLLNPSPRPSPSTAVLVWNSDAPAPAERHLPGHVVVMCNCPFLGTAPQDALRKCNIPPGYSLAGLLINADCCF